MITFPPASGNVPGTETLGAHTTRQLARLCEVVGLDGTDAEVYGQVLIGALASAADRSMALPPPFASFLSDDHTPVEFSLSYRAGAPPALRVLLEPGSGADSLAENGRVGLGVIHDMADRWGFATDQLHAVEDLFFPSSPHGPLTVWCALELRPGGVPQLKVYLNPAAGGPEHATETVQEALGRLGYGAAFAALPPADGYPFLALDIGDWQAPRVKVYLRHQALAASEAGALSPLGPGPGQKAMADLVRVAAGHDAAASGAGVGEPRLDRRPVLTCHSFAHRETTSASGFTLHVPIRDYVRDDAEAYARAADVLSRHGMDTAPLGRALRAVTSRPLQEGRGLISYLALAHEHNRPPRVTTYISSEAYEVCPTRRA